MKQQAKSMHIGILADYGTSLLPNTGIGVFLYNLIEGLLLLDTVPQLTLLVHDGDQRKLRQEALRWGDRVRILPPERTIWKDALTGFASFVLAANEWLDRQQDRLDLWRRGLLDDLERHVWALTQRELGAWKRATGIGSLVCAVRIGLLVLALAPLALVVWAISGLWILLRRFAIPFLAYPFRVGRRVFATQLFWTREQSSSWLHRTEKLQNRVNNTECDVWLVPYAGTPIRFEAPNVVAIPDLVYRHVPETFSLGERRHLESLITRCTNGATLIHCMTRFAAEHDVIPCFPDRADGIRVIRLAPPADLRVSAKAELSLDGLCRTYGVGRRFIFYPAALRVHKNHAMLIRALRLLRSNMGESDLELACTGELQPASGLRSFIEEQDLNQCVHFLGQVPRSDIPAFYRHALMVALPSFHEGWGIPLLEAMQHGCPVACADIPAFREQLEETPEAVPLFNPWDPNSVAKAIKLTIIERNRYLERQQEAYRRMSRRDWRAVAKDFMALFEEAVELSGSPSVGEAAARAD